MNRLILKYGTPITVIILVVFAWVVYRRIVDGNGVLVLAVTAVVVWAVGAALFIFFWPRITVGGFKRAILDRGFGGGPIPVNTLYPAPGISSDAASSGSLLATGTDDVLYIAGWLELKDGPRLLHVPEMDGRYYSLQFTDPATSANFAYVGTRATGTGAGAIIVTARDWNGDVPPGATRITAPGSSALVIGRVFVADERDQAVAYALAQQIRLSPLAA